jgi:hypothetical protein
MMFWEAMSIGLRQDFFSAIQSPNIHRPVPPAYSATPSLGPSIFTKHRVFSVVSALRLTPSPRPASHIIGSPYSTPRLSYPILYFSKCCFSSSQPSQTHLKKQGGGEAQ